MKLLVVSDIHGRSDRLIDLLDMHSDADALIFLGDGLRDLSRAGVANYPMTVIAVRGNGDIMPLPEISATPYEHTQTIEGYKFFMLHGHTRDVKSRPENAVYAAAECGADVLLFGHTHEPLDKYIPAGETLKKPLRVFNPGSLGESYDGWGHFGLIQIKGGHILTSHGKI